MTEKISEAVLRYAQSELEKADEQIIYFKKQIHRAEGERGALQCTVNVLEALLKREAEQEAPDDTPTP